MRYTVQTATLISVIALFTSISLAEDSAAISYRPALIGSHETSLINLIKFPASKKDQQVAIKCEGKISEKGRFLSNACFNGDNKYHQVILKATETATVLPAAINGDPKAVYLLYTVIFVRKGETEQVIAVPNHSTNLKLYRLAYVAPQRLVYKRREYNLDFPTRPFYYLMSATIDARGAIEGIKLADSRKRCTRCKRYVEEVAAISEYIPGLVNNVPTTMRYAEPMFLTSGDVSWYRGISRNSAPSNVNIEAKN